MTTIAFLGDPHVANFTRFGGPKRRGMNTRGELAFYCVRDALRVARKEGATLAIILGDLVDSMRPEPQIIAALRSLFREMNVHGLDIWLLKGNHDSASDDKGDCALYAMQEENTKAVDLPKLLEHDGVPVCMVPFRSGPITEWLPATLEALNPPVNAILCLHAGIKDKETAPWLQGAPDAIERELLSALMDKHEISHCFAGNWHDHRVWEEADIHQVGALCPTGFSNLGVKPYGHVALFTRTEDAEDVDYRIIPGPRFLKLGNTDHPRDLPETADTYFIEWHVAPDRFDVAKAELAHLIEKKHVFAGSVLPASDGVREGLTEAAFAARLAVGLEEAVSNYVGALKIPSHLRRESVEARVRSFLGGST
jgi:hypothetical protein